MFRLPDQKAIINRMGFNSHGKDKVFERLNLLNWDHQTTPLGVNVGKNKLTPEEFALDDFSEGLNTFEHLGKYFVINISSPNTEGLGRSSAVRVSLKTLLTDTNPFFTKFG